MVTKKELGVNDLVDILEKHFRKGVIITGVSSGQSFESLRKHRVGIGGLMTLFLEIDD